MTKQAIAEQLASILNQAKKSNGERKFRAKVWIGGDKVRVYTGERSEFVEIEADGSVTKCRVNMTWSSDISDAIESLSVAR